MNYDGLGREELIQILKRRDANSHYGLHWERTAIDQDHAVNSDFVGLRTVPELCVGDAPWPNLLIEADNFDALRHLATTHSAAFHLIYIDVPYNTGNKDFVYNDSFFDANNRYRHSTWLEFIYQRLALARSLLRNDGAIVVSIDDNELFNLGLLMNQVFGEKSFVANCIWQKRYSRENRGAIGDAHEYLLVYSPNPSAFKERRGFIGLTEEQAKVYRNPDNPRETDPAKRWRGIPMTAQGFRPNQMYSVTSPSGRVFSPPEGRCWSTLETEFLRLNAEGRIHWGRNGDSQPSLIRYLSEVNGLVPWTWWPHDEVGHTDEARKEIRDIFGTQTAFQTPKPVRLMERVLQICAPEKDALILDFFAGSGTTAQAVMKMNAGDEGQRRWVMVSNSESTVEEPEKNIAKTVCQVRLKAVAEGYTGATGTAVPGYGETFAYLVAERVQVHRIEEELTDEMVWNFALLANGHPISVLQSPISQSAFDGQLVVYCANTKPRALDAIRTACSEALGEIVVFTWSPELVSDALPPAARAFTRIVAIPSDLLRAYKRQGAPTAVAGAPEEDAA